MEDIHDKYKHFDWYPAFIVELFRYRNKPSFTTGSTIVNAFIWKSTAQGYNYWCKVHARLMASGYVLSEPETLILLQDALDFYKPLYEELKLTNPELFI